MKGDLLGLIPGIHPQWAVCQLPGALAGKNVSYQEGLVQQFSGLGGGVKGYLSTCKFPSPPLEIESGAWVASEPWVCPSEDPDTGTPGLCYRNPGLGGFPCPGCWSQSLSGAWAGKSPQGPLAFRGFPHLWLLWLPGGSGPSLGFRTQSH